MKQQNDNPYYDLISLSEWTSDNGKKITLLSHYPHMASGLSIRGMYDHFYEEAKLKEDFLDGYSKSIGLRLLPVKERLCDYTKEFVN